MALEKPDARGLVRRLFPPGTPRRLELVRAAWRLAVGPDLARRTEVLAIEGRTLRVRVPDAGWRKVLHRMRGQIVDRLSAIAGEAAPDRLGFQETGGASAPPAPPALRAAAPVPAAPVPAGVAQAAEAIADPELRKGFMDVAARYLARAAGADSPREKGHA